MIGTKHQQLREKMNPLVQRMCELEGKRDVAARQDLAFKTIMELQDPLYIYPCFRKLTQRCGLRPPALPEDLHLVKDLNQLVQCASLYLRREKQSPSTKQDCGNWRLTNGWPISLSFIVLNRAGHYLTRANPLSAQVAVTSCSNVLGYIENLQSGHEEIK